MKGLISKRSMAHIAIILSFTLILSMFSGFIPQAVNADSGVNIIDYDFNYANSPSNNIRLMNGGSYGVDFRGDGLGAWLYSGNDGDTKSFEFDVPADGDYAISFQGYQTYYFGIWELFIDGTKIGSYDFYSSSDQAGPLTTYQALHLTSGVHTITLTSVGKNENSQLSVWSGIATKLELSGSGIVLPPDKSGLTTAISAEIGESHQSPVYVLNQEDYPALNWAAYTSTIVSAIAVEVDPDATQEEIDAASAAIAASKAALTHNSIEYNFLNAKTEGANIRELGENDPKKGYGLSYSNSAYALCVYSGEAGVSWSFEFDVPYDGYYTVGFQGYQTSYSKTWDLYIDGAKIGNYDFNASGDQMGPVGVYREMPLEIGKHVVTLTDIDGSTVYAGKLILFGNPLTSVKTRSTIYTPEKVAAARENVQKYDWAKKWLGAIPLADNYLNQGYDWLWELVPPQTLPRSYAVNQQMGSPVSGKAIDQFGTYPYTWNVINEPWKIIDPSAKDANGKNYMYPTNDFASYYSLGLDEHGIFQPTLAKSRNDELVAKGQPGYLVNILYPDKGLTWGVDDGMGWVDGNGNRYNFIAYYVHWALWNAGEVQLALDYLRNSYIFTGDTKYAKAGLILLDRIADIYPSLNLKDYDSAIYKNNGLPGKGKAVGMIWEVDLAKDFARAYDAFFPVMNDPNVMDGVDGVIAFLSQKGEQYGLSFKNTAVGIRANIEDGILRESLTAAKNADIYGNFGVSQVVLATSAVVLDTMPETKEWLDFLFKPGGYDGNTGTLTGGDVLNGAVRFVDRDGMGVEGAPGYNMYWLGALSSIADILNGYDGYPGADLYQNVKFKTMFQSMYQIMMLERYTPSIGDSGKTGAPELLFNLPSMLKAFSLYGDPIFAQLAYFLNGNSTDGLMLQDVFAQNPEGISDDIKTVIEAKGPLDLGSTNMTGFGFTGLRDGKAPQGEGDADTQRDTWMYYGNTDSFDSHGHRDKLNLGVHAFGLDLSPDLGYPEYTHNTNQTEWVANTVSHNTVVVDKSIQNMQIVGIPKHYDDCGEVKLMDVEAPKVYPQLSAYRRTTAMIKVDDENSYSVDFFKVKGGNDHVFSFHGAEGTVSTEGLNFVAQETGTYAGPDVESGYSRAYDSNDEMHAYAGSGFNWLTEVRKDMNPSQQFSADWNVKDTWNVLNNGAGADTDVHIRLTMLGQLSDVSLAKGIPPQNKPGNPSELTYLLAHNSGQNLDDLFTSVIEPYKGDRFITSITAAAVKVDGVTADGNDVKAVQVKLSNGRTDYIVYSLNPDATYTIDDKIQFRGFFGVYSEKYGKQVYGYINDGSFIAPLGSTAASSPARLQGTVVDFTKDLSVDNHIDVQMDLLGVDINELINKWIYIETNGTRNAVYEIKGIISLGADEYRLDIGDKTPVIEYRDYSDPSQGYIYDFQEGWQFQIPLSLREEMMPASIVTGVTVDPATTTVQQGNTQSFIATVTGQIDPAQDVTWSVSGNTSSGSAINISGVLTVAADETAATLTVTATSSVDTTKSGTATVTVITSDVSACTVTFNSNGSIYASQTVKAGDSIGSAAWPADPARSGYTFGGWFTGENGSGTQSTSATPVNATMTIYAKWTYSGSGGTPVTTSTSSTPSTSTYNADVKVGNSPKTSLAVTVNKDTGTVWVDMGSQSMAQKGTVITIPSIPDVNTYTVGIPVPELSTSGIQGMLTINTDIGSVTVPSDMLTGVTGISGSKAQITISEGEKSVLPANVKTTIGDKPLISLSLSIDGKETDWSNPNVPVTVSIPYTPTVAELLNPESIVVWYIDGTGKVVTIPNGHYDLATGTVTFETTHFSNYAVAYNLARFNDVAKNAWYNKAVSFIAARDITAGTGKGNYSPEARLSRADFLVLMMRAYGIAADATLTDNFSDAGNTYYTDYLATAKRLGITAGTGNNQYSPDKEITRQEMFTLLYDALKAIGQLPGGSTTNGKTLSDFTDTEEIALWAKDAMMFLVEAGTISGSGGALKPTDATTRGEMAQIIYTLLK